MANRGVEMGVLRASPSRAHYSASAQALPNENEGDQLISDGTLKSDHGAPGEPPRSPQRPLPPPLAWYMRMLEKRPVITKAVTAAVLTLLGDVFTQLVIEHAPAISVKRAAVITSLGFMLVGPTLHFWYLTLSKVVKIGGYKGVGARLLLDQLVFSPIFIAVFFICLLTLEGRPSDIAPKLRQDWPSAVLTNWKLWVPFQCINFMFVPQQLQVLFANLVSIIWNAYLSFATHK